MWPFTDLTGRSGAKEEERLFRHVGYFLWYGLGVFWTGIVLLWIVMVVQDMRPVSIARYTRGKLLPPWDIPFPAVTICPQFKKNLAGNGYDLKCEDDDQPGQKSKLWSSILACRFQMANGCSQIFADTITSRGQCVTFNGVQYWSNNSALEKIEIKPVPDMWNQDEGYHEGADVKTVPVRFNPIDGQPSGLIVVFYQIQNATSCFNLASIKVQIHHPAEAPQMDRGYVTLSMHHEVSLAVYAHRVSSVKETREFPHTRNCYFGDEKKLAYFTTYNQANCQLECLANHTLRTCNCVPVYLPRNESTRLCNFQMRSCIQSCESDIVNLRKTNDPENMYQPECDCKKDCNIDKYRAEYASWPFHWKDMMTTRQEGNVAAKLNVYIRDEEYVDVHELDIVYHPMRGLGDFVFILCCLTFLLLIVLVTSLARSRAEWGTKEDPFNGFFN